jgi:hypothetical protein
MSREKRFDVPFHGLLVEALRGGGGPTAGVEWSQSGGGGGLCRGFGRILSLKGTLVKVREQSSSRVV